MSIIYISWSRSDQPLVGRDNRSESGILMGGHLSAYHVDSGQSSHQRLANQPRRMRRAKKQRAAGAQLQWSGERQTKMH